MTNPYPTHQPPYQGYAQPGPGMPPTGPPYAQQPYQQLRPMSRVRPPLTRSQKRAALWSGALGFPLMTLGFTVVVCVLGWSAVVGLIRGVASQMEYKSAESLQTISELDAMWTDYWWAFVLALVVGLAIWVIGYGASIGIAKGGQLNQATGVTWAGLGIASCAGFILIWLGYVIYLVGSIFALALGGDSAGLAFAVYTIVFLVLGIVVWAIVGALSWWWMAHCMRARHPAQRYSGEPYFV